MKVDKKNEIKKNIPLWQLIDRATNSENIVLLNNLSKSEDSYIRFLVAANKFASVVTLKHLLKDIDPEVAFQAELNLQMYKNIVLKVEDTYAYKYGINKLDTKTEGLTS